MRHLATILLVLSPGFVWADDLARYDAKITAADRSHWAFQPVVRPQVPTVKNDAWCRTPIDRFILAKLEEKGWSPSPSPPPRVLLRRVFFDMSGLPPTIAEQDAFLKDPSAEALDRLVDELLARPSYGETWGRHWLDLVRFAESNGYERDATKPSAWRYRDWVIRSLNDDKPYDRFLMEQIAGDELPDATGDTRIATGFARLGPWDDEPSDPKQDRFDQLDDIVANVSEVTMGLSLGCARCHNHKFEPLTQHDYYRMVAVFDPLVRPQYGRTELDLPAGTNREIATIAERDRAIAALEKMKMGLPPAEISAIDAKIKTLHEQTPDLPRGYFWQETSPTPPETYLLLRGQSSAPGPKVGPGMPAVLVESQPEFLPPDLQSTHRRLTLARWLTRPDHPLTARVIVNRVWQFHMGEAIVRSPNDFGTAGDPPTHPELLDWLTDWFVHDANWSLKKLHKLILTSQVTRMGKGRREDYATEDSDNELLWRLPYRRLNVEAIRDAMLSASGQLNPTMYGPSMYPEVPKGALEGNSDPDKVWKASDEREASRRTIYAFVKRSLVVPMIEVLDFCDTTRSAPKRMITNTAPQALALLNGDFANKQSAHFADRLIREAGDDPAKRIDHAYRLALCRPATPAEIETLTQYLDSEAKTIGGASADRRALARITRVIFNLNEFVYVD